MDNVVYADILSLDGSVGAERTAVLFCKMMSSFLTALGLSNVIFSSLLYISVMLLSQYWSAASISISGNSNRHVVANTASNQKYHITFGSPWL